MLIAPLILIGWLAAELYVAIRVGDAIGALPTVLLLIASWPIGAWTARTEGRAALARLRAAVAEGRAPGREVLDGAMVLIGGGLLMVPGFIADVVGTLLLIGPTRALARRGVLRSLRRRLAGRPGPMGPPGPARGPSGYDVAGAAGYDVDSTASDVRPPRLEP
jgi:UPF0716 protein FxsA